MPASSPLDVTLPASRREHHAGVRNMPFAAEPLHAGSSKAVSAEVDFRFDCADPAYPDAVVLKCRRGASGGRVVVLWPRWIFGPAASLSVDLTRDQGAQCLRVHDCSFPSMGGAHRNRRFPLEIKIGRNSVGQWQIWARIAMTWGDFEPLDFPPIDIQQFLKSRGGRLPRDASAIDTGGVLFSSAIEADRMDGVLLPGLFGDSICAGRAKFGFDNALTFFIAPLPAAGETGSIRMAGMPGRFEALAFRMTGQNTAAGLNGSLHGYIHQGEAAINAPVTLPVGGWPTDSHSAQLRICAKFGDDGPIVSGGSSECERSRPSVTALVSHQGAPQASVTRLRWQPAEDKTAATPGVIAVDWRQAGGIRSETRIPFSAFEIVRQAGVGGVHGGRVRYFFTPAVHVCAVKWQDASFAVSALLDPMGETGAAREALIEICAEEAGAGGRRLTAFSARLAMHSARLRAPRQVAERSGTTGQQRPPIRVQFVGADIAFWLPVLGPPPAFSGGALVPLGPAATEGQMAHVSLERAREGSVRRIGMISPGVAVSGLTLNAFRRVPGHTEVRLVTTGGRREARS